uniref:Uncharacterized protein n=1 Tax=Arundo donax TaxID=35708 RepID=A0A0A8ZCS2_ARUDO
MQKCTSSSGNLSSGIGHCCILEAKANLVHRLLCQTLSNIQRQLNI